MNILNSHLLCGIVSFSLCYRILRRPYQVLVSSIDLDPVAVFVPVAYFFDTYSCKVCQKLGFGFKTFQFWFCSCNF